MMFKSAILKTCLDKIMNNEITASSELTTETSLTVLCFVTLVIGVISGLIGMGLALLLHYLQHLAFGYSPHLIISNESFLQGVSAASPTRRILVLIICGVVAGIGWFMIYRYGNPLVSIPAAIKQNQPKKPILTTTAHALLQIITVALGSPLGREVAPREIAATFACWFTAKTGLNANESKIMVACAAGAGLAAVYNVPFGATVFILETLLGTFAWSALLPAIATCTIATVVSWIGLGNEAQYHISVVMINYSITIWAILIGPIVGLVAYWFYQLTVNARSKAPYHSAKLILFCLLSFTIIGLLATQFPALLGNGKGSIELGFSNSLSIQLAFMLLTLRILIIWMTLRAGAEGGLLTPSLANGSLLAVVLGGMWNFVWPGNSAESYAIIGAAAFLAAAHKMPLTAIILIAEFTEISFGFLIPILFAVAGSVSVFKLCEKKYVLKSKH